MKAKSILAKFRNYARNEAGNLTMILSLSAVPLIAATGLAVDMARITEARSAIQGAADGAALAAALAAGTDEERRDIALAFVDANLSALPGVSTITDAVVDGNEVSVDIDAVVEGTLLAVAFPKQSHRVDGETPPETNLSLPSVAFTIGSAAEAEAGDSYYRCVIALNPSAENAIYFKGTGDFTAEDCVVHSNSAHDTASIHRQGNADAIADGFTAVGGAKNTGAGGSYSVTPKEDQAAAADPFGFTVTAPGGAATTTTVKKQNGNVSLSAAKYGNITIQTQGQATFTPGIHYITGTLSIASQATVTGTGVTLVLVGNNAKIDMNSNGNLKLQAPTGGDFPGFVVVGDKSATTVQTNTIQGGAGTYLRGAWYTPKHKLYVTGNGDFNMDSSYFPFVVDTVEISGNGEFNLGFDWDAYGYPEPTGLIHSQAGKARLVN